MENSPENIIALIFGCYMIAITIVLFSGAVPTKWRTWPVIHGVAWAVPVMVLAGSLLIAIPGLMVLLIIVAATSRPR